MQWLLSETGGDPRGTQDRLHQLWEDAFRVVERHFDVRLRGVGGELRGHLSRANKLVAAELAGLRWLARGYGWHGPFLDLAEPGYLSVAAAL